MGRKRQVNRRHLPPILNCTSVSFIDTIVLSMPKLMPLEHFRELRVALVNELRPQGRRFVLKTHRYGADGFLVNLHVHQPTMGALKLLASCGLIGRVTQVHVALDVTVDRAQDAEVLRRYLEARLCISDRPKRQSTEYGGVTTYFNRPIKAGIEVAIYSDRLSKVSYEPCCHVEWRLKGAAVLRRFGLSSPTDIVALCPQAFWSDVLRLSRPPQKEQLVAARTKELRNQHRPEHTARRDVAMVLRAVTGPTGLASAHNLRCLLREHPWLFGRRAYRLFVDESVRWLLPSNTHMPW